MYAQQMEQWKSIYSSYFVNKMDLKVNEKM